MMISENLSFDGLDDFGSRADLGALGAREFYIFDEETEHRTEDAAVIKSACPPFMLAQGYVTVPLGAEKGQYREAMIEPGENIPKRPGFLSPPGLPAMSGLGSLGFWQVVDPGGGAVATFS